MKKDNIFGIVIIACGLLIILSVFLPYVTYYSTSISLWKLESASRIIYILLGLFVIALYLLNKKTEMSYLAAGYGAFTAIETIIDLEGIEGLSIAFYLILLSSIAIGVLTFLYNEKEADALINLSVSVNRSTVNNQVINQYQQVNQPQPMMNGSQMNPILQQQPVRFDPMTGQPINNQNNN